MSMSHYKFQKIILPIKGMHCRSCELLLEEKFSQIEQVEKSDVNYRRGLAEIYYTKQKPASKDLAEAVIAAGYEVGETEKAGFFSRNLRDYQELLWAIATVFVAFGALKFFGITDLVNFNFGMRQASYGMVALIGLVAGFSSCMALIGGLVLGLSAKHVEKHPEATVSQKFRPHLFFNLGRIGGYALLGGLLGMLGSIFQLSTLLTSFLTLFAGAVMLFVGLQLIAIFPRLNSWKLALPKGLAKFFGRNRHQAEYNHKNSMLVGALTFFLPCGFTQAMQIYAVASGSFLSGAIIMGLFALGTAPGLLAIGGLTAVLKGLTARKFFKIAGVVVIMFAFFNLANSLTLAGINLGGKGKAVNPNYQDPNVRLVNGVQVVKMTENYAGYSPNEFTIKAGVPVEWIVDVKAPYSCAASLIVPKLNIRKNLTAGQNIIKFIANEAGKIPFSCGMGMYTGVFNVADKDSEPAASAADNLNKANGELSVSGPTCGATGGGCGGCGRGATAKRDVADTVAQVAADAQVIKSTYKASNYLQPNGFKVRAGQSVKFIIDVKDNGRGCGYAIMIPGLHDNAVPLLAGQTITMDFTPTTPGSYDITCGMGMIRYGLITVE